MLRWAWPRLCALAHSNHMWMKLLLNSPPMPNPTLKPLPTEDFLLTLIATSLLCWRAVVARTTEFRNRRTEMFLLAFFCQASDSHNSPARFSDYGKPFVSQNSLMTLSTNFPRRSSVTLQEKWSPAMIQRLSLVSLVMEATVATLPFPYTPRCRKVTQLFKPNVSWGRGKRETRGTTPLGASGHW